MAAAVGGWCLLWLAAAVAPGVAGRRRWREGTPGGRLAVAAAACGAGLPALTLGVSVTRGVWPDEPPLWGNPELAWRFEAAWLLLTVTAAVALGLLVSAGAAAARAATPPAPPRPPLRRTAR